MNLYLCILLLVSLGIPSGFTYTVYIDRNFGTKQYCYEGYEQQFCLNNYYGFQTGEAKTFCNRMCNIDKYNKSPPVYAFQIINKLGLTMQANLAADTDPYSFVTIEFTYFGSYPLQIDLMQTTLQALLFTPILPRPPTGYIVPSTDASYYVFSVLQSYPQYNPTVADSTFDVSDILSVFCSSEFFQIKAASINILKSDFNDIFLQQALIIQLSSPNSFQAVSLRSIRISKNCVANCLTCLDDTNCLTCMSGMTTYTFSSGIVGCVQSGLACSALANCFTCAISDTESACFSCYPGFNFNLGICAASKQTPSTPCTNHQYNLNGVCYTYSSIGYYEDRVDSNFNPITSLTAFQIQKTYKCPQGTLVIAYKQNNYSNYVCKCFFDLCISCSTISTCDLCASGYAFDESTNLCQPINLTSNPFTFSQEVTSTGYLFKIVFSKGILYSQLTNNDFKVVISDIIDYTYNFDGFKNGDTIEISVTCREMVKGKTATITFTNLIFVSGNLMATSTILVDLEGFMNLSQSILQISSDVKFLSNLVATFIVCLLIPIAFLGFFGMIMYTTDIIAFLYYDLFIAVRFPINVVNFAQGFKILQLDFVINFFGTLLNSNTFQSSRIQWMKQPTDGYFLASTGQMISVFLVIIILYLFTKMISKMDFPHISDIFKRAVIQTWEFSALLYAVWFVYIYILMGVLMYLFDPSCKSSTSCSLNKTLFALSFIIVALFPIFVAYLIRYMNEQRFEKYLAMKLAALISGIRLFTQKDLLLPKQQNKYFLEEDPTKQQVLNQAQIEQIRFASSLEMQMMGRRDKIIFVLTKYTVLVLYLRKMIFSLIICFLNSSPNIQIIFISLINLFMAMFFTFLKPYQSRYENIKQTLSELFMILYQIFILILVSDPADQKEENRILIGWGVILIASLIIIWHTISIVVLFWQAARVIYAQWKLNKEQGKIIPQESLFNQNIFDNSASSSSEAIQIFERNNKRTNTLSQVSNMFMPHKLGETEQDKKSPRKKQESEIVSGVLDLNRNESKVRPSLYTPTVTASPETAIAFLPGTRSYHVYLDRNFGEKKDCLSDLSLTFFGPTDLTPPTPPDSNAIDYLCTNFCSTDNFASRQKISSLSIINTIGALIQINLASNTDPYSSVKVELTYFGKYPITAELQYPDSKDASFAFSQASSYPFTNYASYTLDPTIVDTSFDVADASTVICPNIMKIKASTLVIAKSTITAIQSPEPALVLKLTVAGSYNLSNLRSIRVSKNCVENCLVCGSDTSCSTCQSGFVSNTFTSGITACEQVGSVCSALSNCLSCAISGADSACLSCYPGYTLSSSGTCTADTPTPASSCTGTQYNRQGVCTEYSSLGYYESRYDSSLVPIKSLSSTEIQTTYKCHAGMLVVAQKENNYQNYKCKCFFADCISCSSFESCDVCSSGYIFDYSSKQCVVSAIKKSDLSIKQNVTYTGYTFKISFSNGIQYSSLKASDISVSITDFTAFTYSLIGIKNGKTIDISVACNKLVKHKKITITFTNFAFVSANGLNQSSVSTDLEPFLNLSQVEYNRAKLAKTIAQVIATIIVWFLIPIAFLGYFSTMMIKIDVIAFLYYVLFISIRFPINLTSFAQAFKILQLDFVINFFGSLVNTNTFLDSAVQWMKQSTDCYFLASTGQSISVFTVVIGLYLFTKMMANMDFAYISDYFKKAVIRTWEFGGILNGVWLVFIYVVVGVFLQFQDLSCNDSSCSLNYTLMAFSGVIAGIIPILVFCLVRYAASVTYESYLVMKLASLLTGIRLFAQKDLLVIKEENQFKLEIEPVKKQQQQQQSQTAQQQQIFFCSSLEVSQMNKRQKLMFTWTKYVIPILYVRKVVFALIICFLYNYPYLQIAAISVINFAGASYFMIIQPFTEKYQNLKAAISELMMIVFQGLAALLISDGEDQSEDTRILIGWGMILIASLLILWHAISIIVQFGKVVRTYYLNWKSQRSRAKVVSLQVDDQSSNNSPDIKRKPILQFQDYSNRDNPKGNNQNSGNCEEHPAEEEDDATNNQSPPKKGGQGQIMQQLFLNSGQKSQDNLLMYSPKRVRNSKLSIIAGHQESQPQSFYDLPQSSNQVQGIVSSSNQAKMISLKEKAK